MAVAVVLAQGYQRDKLVNEEVGLPLRCVCVYITPYCLKKKMVECCLFYYYAMAVVPSSPLLMNIFGLTLYTTRHQRYCQGVGGCRSFASGKVEDAC